MAHHTMSAREWGLLFFLSFLWGASFLFIRIAMEDIGPLTLVFLRTAIAAIILWVVITIRGLKMPKGRDVWGSLFVLGILNNIVPFALLFWGEIYISVGLASILNGLTPLFAVVLAHYIGHNERITPNRVLGLVLGIGGVTVLIGPGLLGELFGVAQGGIIITVAKIALVVASACYALAGIYARRFREYPPLVIATGQVTASALMSVPLMFLIEHPLTHSFPVWQTWMSVAWLAVLSTALAYAIYFRLLATAGSTNITLVTLLAPVTAILLGWLVLGEHLLPQHFGGMALIFAGLMAIDGRIFRYLKTRNL